MLLIFIILKVRLYKTATDKVLNELLYFVEGLVFLYLIKRLKFELSFTIAYSFAGEGIAPY